MPDRSRRLGPPAHRRSRALVGALLALVIAPAAALAAPGDTATTANSSQGTTASSGGATASSGGATASSNSSASATQTTATQTVTATQTATLTETHTATATATQTKTTRVVVPDAPERLQLPTSLTGWLGSTVAFPNRALLLSGPATGLPSASQLSLKENGTSVTDATVTSLSTPAADDLGVMLVVGNTASMAPNLHGVFSAGDTLAAQRPAAEQVGLITFNGTPDTVLAPTTDANRISHAFSTVPTAGSGADIGAATQTAVQALARARVALGVAVVVSDGVGLDASAAAAAQSTAAAAHVPVVTIGLRDNAATAASLAALRRAAPGTFVTATPTSLPERLALAVNQQVSTHELVTWKSSIAAGHAVTVTASAAGVPGTVSAGYSTPAPAHHAAASHHAARRPAAHPHPARHPVASASATATTPTPTPVPSPVPASAPVSSFWHSSAGVLLIAAVIALLVGAMIMFLLRRPDQRAVRNRVGSFIPADSQTEDGALISEEPTRKGLVGMLQRGTWWPAFVEAVEVSRNPKSAGFLMKRAALVAVLLSPLMALLTHVVFLFIVPLIAFPFVERWWVMRAARKQREKFADTLPGYMQDMASAIRVGRSFAGALAVVADSADEPTRSEFDRAVTDESLGRPVEESLAAVGVRMQSTEMDQIALIAELNRRSGSNVAEALDRVAEGARDRADLRREMRALTAQSKMSSSVLTGLPVVLTLGISMLAPRYAHPLFHTTMGWISMGVAAFLVFTGWKVLKKISNVGV